jgi:hypothetical protein
VTANVIQGIIFLGILVIIYVPNAIKNAKLALNLINVSLALTLMPFLMLKKDVSVNMAIITKNPLLITVLVFLATTIANPAQMI